MTPQLLAGHVQGYQAIKAEKSDLQTGVTLNVIDFEPGGELSPYEEIRRKAYGVWLEAVRRTEDFTGVQVYYLIPIPGTGKPYPPLPEMPYVEKGNPMAAIQRPEALKNSVEYIHAETKKPIFVTENGIETDNDQRRIWYIDQALSGLHEAIAGGVPVLGYVHWSLLDNYEWARVYKPKYGLVEVDRITFKRKPKPSAGHLGRIAARNGL
jgi:beta-glucosidase